MKFLLGSVAHNQHITQIARALFEAEALGAFYTGGVDVWNSALARKTRKLLGYQVDRRLLRRRITDIPECYVFPHWKWEAARLAAGRFGSESAEDWCWERSEMYLDHKCSSVIERQEFGGFIGTEFGSLSALSAARAAEKPAAVVFLSPHHRMRAAWVDREYERFPALLSPVTKKLLDLGAIRDTRRDEEASVADIVITGSRVTADSLIAAGVRPEKIIVVPLGCPEICNVHGPRSRDSGTIRFVYAGPVSVRKGAHYLIQAWQQLAIGRGAELHFYGSLQLPSASIVEGPGMYLHGNVPPDELCRAYHEADCLVFPTLCDGFGLVAGEAFSHGVPVLTTENAGAADLIRPFRNGLLVPPADPQALAAGMQWIVDNRKLLPEMREEARSTARSWTWQHFREALWSELSSALLARVPASRAKTGVRF